MAIALFAHKTHLFITEGNFLEGKDASLVNESNSMNGKEGAHRSAMHAARTSSLHNEFLVRRIWSCVIVPLLIFL